MDLKRAHIGVLMGGPSGERDVSLTSGSKVYDALARQEYRVEKIVFDDPDALVDELTQVDVIFNCLHGGLGEDGTIQLLCEMLERPYTGSRPLACVRAMDKLLAKDAFRTVGLRVPAHLESRDEPGAEWPARVEGELGFPCVVKPVRQGSSLGVRIVREPSQLVDATRATRTVYGECFVERYIPGVELTAGILRLEGEDRALPLIELRPKREFYDYEAKYTPGMTEFIVPAQLDTHVAQRAQEAALQAHRALGCFGFSRVDMRVTPEGDVYVLEVNTVPGMTETSDLPQAAAAVGIPFDELVERMLRTSVEKTNVSFAPP